MKKNFYLFSFIVLITAFFGFKKANSYDFEKGFIATVGNSRDGQITNSLMTNMDFYSYSTNLAYTGTDELEAYWYGIGIGIAETLCYLTLNGNISSNLSRNLMRDYRNIYRGEKDFRSKTFEEGVELAINGYSGCRL